MGGTIVIIKSSERLKKATMEVLSMGVGDYLDNSTGQNTPSSPERFLNTRGMELITIPLV